MSLVNQDFCYKLKFLLDLKYIHWTDRFVILGFDVYKVQLSPELNLSPNPSVLRVSNPPIQRELESWAELWFTYGYRCAMRSEVAPWGAVQV